MQSETDPLGEVLPAQDGNDEGVKGEGDPKDEPPKKKSRFEVETLSEENSCICLRIC